MSKIDVTQTIKGFNGKDQKFGISPETQQYVSNLLNELWPLINNQEEAKEIIEAAVPTKTLRDVMLGALMAADQNDSTDRKVEDFKLMSKISTEDTPDLGDTEKQRIFKRISKSYNHTIIVGRCQELLDVTTDE